jgi:Icc protein
MARRRFPMPLAFLTDLHLGTAGQYPLGVDVRQNFRAALDWVRERTPDALVIGGDVCLDVGEAETYRWFREQVEELPFPWYAISGNHDDSVMMARELGLERYLHGEELYFAETIGGTPALFLDTSRGRCSEAQWAWLRTQLTGRDEALIFMHHPPVRAGVRHMDAHYAFGESERFREIIQPLHRATVVCGHYHVERVVQRENLTIFITPSLFFQLKPDTPELAYDHFRIGIREIDLLPESLMTNVQYLDGHQNE